MARNQKRNGTRRRMGGKERRKEAEKSGESSRDFRLLLSLIAEGFLDNAFSQRQSKGSFLNESYFVFFASPSL